MASARPTTNRFMLVLLEKANIASIQREQTPATKQHGGHRVHGRRQPWLAALRLMVYALRSQWRRSSALRWDLALSKSVRSASTVLQQCWFLTGVLRQLFIRLPSRVFLFVRAQAWFPASRCRFNSALSLFVRLLQQCSLLLVPRRINRSTRYRGCLADGVRSPQVCGSHTLLHRQNCGCRRCDEGGRVSRCPV